MQSEMKDRFLGKYQLLVNMAKRAFSHQIGDTREERIANAIGLAWKHWTNATRKAECDDSVLIGCFKWAIHQTICGRQVHFSQRINDPFQRERTGGAAQCNVIESLIDRKASPADRVAFEIDTSDWLSSLSSRQRDIAIDMMAGHDTSSLAAKYNLSNGRISQLRRELHTSYVTFVGN